MSEGNYNQPRLEPSRRDQVAVVVEKVVEGAFVGIVGGPCLALDLISEVSQKARKMATRLRANQSSDRGA